MTFSRRDFLSGSVCTLAAGASPRVMAQDAAAVAPRLIDLTARSGKAFELAGQAGIIPLQYESVGAAQPLRVKQGEKLNFKVTNALEEPTSLHIRGFRAPQPAALTRIAAKGSAELALELSDSGTYWLHPLETTQSARGLGTMLIVEEAEPPIVHLDMPLVIQDWAKPTDAPNFSLNGQMIGTDMAARPGTRIRMRLVNACVTRGFLINIAGTVPYIIAIDGSPSEIFRPVKDTFPVGPGARFDLMLDVPAGKPVEIRLNDGKTTLALVKFHADGEPREILPPIAALAPNPALPEEIHLEESQRLEVNFGGFASVMDLQLQKDAPATLALSNQTKANLSVYLAGQIVRLLHPFDDGWEPYWRDTLLLGAGQTIHVALLPHVAGRFFIETTQMDGNSPPERLGLVVN